MNNGLESINPTADHESSPSKPSTLDDWLQLDEKAPFGSVDVEVEPFPKKLCKEVVLNPRAADFLDKENKSLASEENILNSALLVVPRGEISIDGKHMLTPGLFGRALSCRLGRIPYAGLLGEQIIYKGIGPSGYLYPSNFTTSEGKSLIVDSKDPAGFLFKSDNDLDLQWSNFLLEKGMRSSLNIGYILLDENYLFDFIHQKWGREDKRFADDTIRSIQAYKNQNPENSELVISARIGGVSQRIQVLHSLIHTCHKSVEPSLYYKNLVRANIAHGSRLLYAESLIYPDKFSAYTENAKILDIQQTLKRVAEYNPVNTLTLDMIGEILVGMVVVDGKKIEELGKTNKDFKLLYNYFPAMKDIDFSFIHYDFDVINEGGYKRYAHLSNPNRYAELSAQYISEYLWCLENLMNHREMVPNNNDLFNYKDKILSEITSRMKTS